MHFFLREPGRVLERRLQVLAFEIRIVGEDLVLGRSVRELPGDDGHGNPHAADAGPAAENPRVESDPLELHGTPSWHPACRHYYPGTSSSAAWSNSSWF